MTVILSVDPLTLFATVPYNRLGPTMTFFRNPTYGSRNLV